MIVDNIDTIANNPKPIMERIEKRFLDFFKLFIAKISPTIGQNEDINERHLEITKLVDGIIKIENGIITVKIKSRVK